MAVLTDDGGGVSTLAAVVTPASHAGQFADGGREDDLDPSCVVSHCCKEHGAREEEEEEEERNFGYSVIHRELFNQSTSSSTSVPKHLLLLH